MRSDASMLEDFQVWQDGTQTAEWKETGRCCGKNILVRKIVSGAEKDGRSSLSRQALDNICPLLLERAGI